MSITSLAWKIALALIGCVLGAYVGQGLIGGGALGWAATGAIVAGFCYPLYKTLMAHRATRQP